MTASGRIDPTRHIRAPRSARLTDKNWLGEAPYRMIHPFAAEIATSPGLVVCGSISRAAGHRECADATRGHRVSRYTTGRHQRDQASGVHRRLTIGSR